VEGAFPRLWRGRIRTASAVSLFQIYRAKYPWAGYLFLFVLGKFAPSASAALGTSPTLRAREEKLRARDLIFPPRAKRGGGGREAVEGRAACSHFEITPCSTPLSEVATARDVSAAKWSIGGSCHG